ncbi:MAG: hypothetical protein ACRCSB_01760 [Bacteroidales bacterium]
MQEHSPYKNISHIILSIVFILLLVSSCGDALKPGEIFDQLEYGDLDNVERPPVTDTTPQTSQPDALIRTRGALGILGFAKDKEGNYIVLIRQNNAHDNAELRISKCDANGRFIADRSLLGANSQDGGATEAGKPGGFGSGRLAYNSKMDKIAVLTCYTGLGHQYSFFDVLNNDNDAFAERFEFKYGGHTYSHSFDQRVIYHKATNLFYQMQHGDAYPRAMGIATVSLESKEDVFSAYIVRPPKSNTGYGGNSTRTRIGDIAVFDNGDVASTILTPFYDNKFIQSFLPDTSTPCYSYVSGADAPLSVSIWNAAGDATDGHRYTKNVLLDITPFKSATVVKDGSLGVSPSAINLSGYAKKTGLTGAIPKTTVFGNEVLVAWLTYSGYNYNNAATTLQQTVFCIYDRETNRIVQKDSVPGAEIYHTVSILSYGDKAKWITPNETVLVYHELDLNTFKTSGFKAAHLTKSIPLKTMAAKTVPAISGSASGQFSPVGVYGQNPAIDYVLNEDGSMDILWMNEALITNEHKLMFRRLYVTSINNQGEFSKVIEVPVRSVK